MKKALCYLLVLAVLFIAQAEVMVNGTEKLSSVRLSSHEQVALPSPILKTFALEFEGVLADYVFLETLVFVGKSFERKEKPRIKQYEWDWILSRLQTTTDLDPYFLDPYYFANSELVWDGERIVEAIELLEKGTKYRSWDWMPPFFAGFAAHYFIRDDERAVKLLMESAQRSGADPLIATLAARLAAGANMKGNAVLFLQKILDQNPDPITATLVGERLEALKGMFLLEKSVEEFKSVYDRLPDSLQELVDVGIISHLPIEPYGGRYILDPRTGEVSSSTGLGQFVE